MAAVYFDTISIRILNASPHSLEYS